MAQDLTKIRDAFVAKIGGVLTGVDTLELVAWLRQCERLAAAGYPVSNVATLQSTIDTRTAALTGASDSFDLIGLAKALPEAVAPVAASSYVGSAHFFPNTCPLDFTTAEGHRFLRSGAIETDTAKFNPAIWRMNLGNGNFSGLTTAGLPRFKKLVKLTDGNYFAIPAGVAGMYKGATPSGAFSAISGYTNISNIPLDFDYHAATNTIVVLFHTGLIEVSKDNGVTWTSKTAAIVGVGTPGITGPGMVRFAGNVLYVAGDTLLRKSTNYGDAFTSVTLDSTFASSGHKLILNLFEFGSRLVVVAGLNGSTQTNKARVSFTDNGGTSWTHSLATANLGLIQPGYAIGDYAYVPCMYAAYDNDMMDWNYLESKMLVITNKPASVEISLQTMAITADQPTAIACTVIDAELYALSISRGSTQYIYARFSRGSMTASSRLNVALGFNGDTNPSFCALALDSAGRIVMQAQANKWIVAAPYAGVSVQSVLSNLVAYVRVS